MASRRRAPGKQKLTDGAERWQIRAGSSPASYAGYRVCLMARTGSRGHRPHVERVKPLHIIGLEPVEVLAPRVDGLLAEHGLLCARRAHLSRKYRSKKPGRSEGLALTPRSHETLSLPGERSVLKTGSGALRPCICVLPRGERRVDHPAGPCETCCNKRAQTEVCGR